MIESVKVIEVIEVQLRGGVKELWSRDGEVIHRERPRRQKRTKARSVVQSTADIPGYVQRRKDLEAIVAQRKAMEHAEVMRQWRAQRVPPPFDPKEGYHDPREGPVMEVER